MNQNQTFITAFYLFFRWPESTVFTETAEQIEKWCESKSIKGLLLIGSEGFNGTMASPSLPLLNEFKDYITKKACLDTELHKVEFKDSESHFMPFRRTKVKVKKEIVTLGKTEIVPDTTKDKSHLSPTEWNEFIKTKNPIILDVRNTYEMKIGKFKSALDWEMNEFTEFPKLVENLNLDKSEPVLMYCTGGIRCEKASLEMKSQGFQNVFQLDGGILNYLSQYPNEEFEGECFVFDHRVAVDQNLKPTTHYVLCHHCGQPAEISPFECIQCGTTTIVCENCLETNIDDLSIRTCSKNCRHHYKLNHKSTKPHLDAKKNYKESVQTSVPVKV
jgi:UPF0176 protein